MAVSQRFRDAFAGGGGCSMECRCGRTHFGERGHWDWNEGEYERLVKLAEEKPNEFVYHPGDDGVMASRMGFVWDCECKGNEHLEDFILENGSEIAGYLYKRAKARAVELVADMHIQASADEALEELDALKRERSERANLAHIALTGKSAPRNMFDD